MGCDIHILTEYKRKDGNYPSDWQSLTYHPVNPGRNYTLFAKLSGVRSSWDDDTQPIATPGWPEEDISWAARSARTVYITEDPARVGFEGAINMETAERWLKLGSRWVTDKTGKNIGVTNPDWHSYGTCTIEQMSKALRKNSSPEYRAMLAAARSLEKDGMEVRFLFFYDN